MFFVNVYVQPNVDDIYTGYLRKPPTTKNPTIMITAADDIVLDTRTTCTKDEAVAKLLGWMQGEIRLRYIHLTDSGISADQLPHLHSLEGSLADLLSEFRRAARSELIEAFEADAAPEILDQKELAVSEWAEKIKKAGKYFRDIDDELAKGDESVLKVDDKASEETGTLQIRLSSLETWATKRYGISVLGSDVEQLADSHQNEQSSVDEEEPSADGGLDKQKADNLFISLAFLVDAFAQTAEAYRSGDRPNVIAISKRIEAVAKAANKNVEIPVGQGFEVIRKRITEAMKRKNKKLSGEI